MYYLVFERTYPGDTFDHQYGRTIVAPDPGGVPLYDRVQTVVEADSAEAAVQAVMAQTRRMGEAYAVVECQFLSFIPDNGSEVKGGIVRATKALNGGEKEDA